MEWLSDRRGELGYKGLPLFRLLSDYVFNACRLRIDFPLKKNVKNHALID